MLQVRTAARQNVKARIILSGPAGSGKTMGALLFAHGLCSSVDQSSWGKIGLIDTEAGSGELYAGSSVPGLHVTIGDYAYVGIDPPFTVNKFSEALQAMEAHGVDVIIIDSLTHLWQGEGGILDKQGKVAAQTKNSYTAWNKITPELNQFVESMLRSRCHLLLTLRAKMEYAQAKDETTGKTKIEKLGLAPIFREGIIYEANVVFDIDQNHTVSCSKDRTGIYDGLFFKINPADGKKYLDWSNSGATPIERPPVEREEPQPTVNGGTPEPEQTKQETPKPTTTDEGHATRLLSPAQVKYIGSQIKKLFIDSGLGGTGESVSALICEKFGNVDTIEEIPMQNANEILVFLKDEAAVWKETVAAAHKKADTSIDAQDIPF